MGINNLKFKILDVEHGWILAMIETETEQVFLSNSYLGGLQMPQTFLKAINELLSNNKREKWLCWYGENNSYIWHLMIINDSLKLFIYDGDSSFGFPSEGNILSKYSVSAETLLEANSSLFLFAQSVCDAFKVYSFGEEYDIWQNSQYKDMFPRAEFSQLRRILRQNRYKSFPVC